MTLTQAVDFALKHSRPAAGVISVAEAIKLAIVRKKNRSKVYQQDLKNTVEEESDVEVYWSLTPKRVKDLAKTSASG